MIDPERREVVENFSSWAVWFVVEQSAKTIGIERLSPRPAPHCVKRSRKSGRDLEQIKFLLGHCFIQTTERYLGSEQETAGAVNDSSSF